jgi:hypothetical protein
MPSISAASGALSAGQDEGARGGVGSIALHRRAHRQRAVHCAQFAGERQLAGEFMLVQRRRLELLGGDQDAKRDRQVEATGFLGQVGRGPGLTVIRRWGNSKPQFWIAARTRSRASRTSVSGKRPG